MFLYSLEYFLLLPFLLVVYYNCKGSFRLLFLLLLSFICISYYNISSVFFLIFFNTLNYWAGASLAAMQNKNNRKVLFYSILSLNVLAIIFINKILYDYWVGNFEIKNSFSADNTEHGLLALGLSFYGLQNISYLIDVYYKRIVAAANYWKFSLFNAFFPKVSLGPIMRYPDFEKELKATASFQKTVPENLVIGTNRILLGLLKKLVLADRLVPVTMPFFAQNEGVSGASLWVSVFAFFLQLYFDFSGYMDIALGSGRLFGFKLNENFNLPLRAVSIADFWRRWHISLMDWLTTYVYFPLSFALRRYKQFSITIAILITFFISGLWHGWGLTFILYAMVHAIYMMVEYFIKRSRVKFSGLLHYRLKWFDSSLVFILVAISLIFFRAPDVNFAAESIYRMFDFENFFDTSVSWRTWLINGGGNIEVTFNNRLSVVLSLLFILYEAKIEAVAKREALSIRYIFLSILSIIVFGAFGNVQRFIYLQF